jgi:outer membrane scaffolding protein for murein synthesis (MipA/OmpV family)
VAGYASAQESGVSVTLGVGPKVAPAYFGSDETAVGLTGSFGLNRLSFGPLALGGDASQDGWGFKGGFRYIGARDASQYSALTGMDDVPLAIELGGGLDYTTNDYSLYADVRYGVVGHQSFVAEVGGDLYYRPTDRITVSGGPRLFWGDDTYAQTYFGVTGAEALASGGGLASFDAGGGLLSAGIEGAVSYQVDDNWGITGTVTYEQLTEDAARSPISLSNDQLSASIVVTRNISFGF